MPALQKKTPVVERLLYTHLPDEIKFIFFLMKLNSFWAGRIMWK